MALHAQDSYKTHLNHSDFLSKDPKTGKLIQKMAFKIQRLERLFSFRVRDLRSIARNQLFILIKKSIITNSPEMYQEEIKKLIEFELQIHTSHRGITKNDKKK